MKKLWNLHIGWDDVIPEEISNEFQHWQEQSWMLQNLRVPYWIFGQENDQLSFHMFVDANQHVYAVALFVRCKTTFEVSI